MKHVFKKVLAVAAIASASFVGNAAVAEYPERPITMIVPFSAGTSTDTVSRLIAKVMSDNLGQPIVVENRAGAGGSVGTSEVVKA
ncbi:MAG TPA: ABC transporter substrate-binding protein, partial [Rhodospirillaceae bacterium]|nr:ABC transporter substrate-binding protein [Rhodospirillaceae bacterium]